MNASWRRVKGWPGWAALAAVLAVLMLVGVTAERGPRTPQERVEDISKRLACPICDGESVFDSRNNASTAIRNEIQAQVAEGLRTDAEIITFIEQRYGGQVLLVPRASGIDALVWVVPVAVAVLAIAGLAMAFRRWRQAADTAPTDDDRALVAAALADDAAAGAGSGAVTAIEADAQAGTAPPDAPAAPG